jgi:hypothetical protein
MMRAHLLLLTCLLAPAPAFAATPVVILPATGANVHEGHLAAATDLLRAELERTGSFLVGLAPGPEDGGEATPAEAGEAARAAGVSLAVTLRVTRLERNASVRLAAYRPDGSAAHLDEIGAAGADDLEPAIRRLALGLAQGRPARMLAELDTVTEREADPLRKVAATHVFGLRLGTAVLMDRASSTGETSRTTGGGLFWLYDARSFLADVSFDVYLGNDHVAQTGIGFYYPFSRGNVTPYAGGGLAYTWLETGGDGAAGLSLRAGGGLLLGRLSTVQVRLDGGWQLSTFEEKRSGQHPHSPHGPFITLGLGH